MRIANTRVGVGDGVEVAGRGLALVAHARVARRLGGKLLGLQLRVGRPAVACVLVTLKTRSRGTHSTECDYSTESTKKKTHIAHFSVLVPGAYF